MHIGRPEGPQQHGLEGPQQKQPALRPGPPIGSVARLGSPTGDIATSLLAQWDTALFRSLTEKDAAKILDILQRVSVQAAMGSPESYGKETGPAKAFPIEEVTPTPGLAALTSSQPRLEETASSVHAMRFQAEAWIAKAEDAINQPQRVHLRDWDSPPEALLRVSQDVYAQGGYINYLQSSELAQALLNSLHAPLVVSSAPTMREWSARGRWRGFARRSRQQLQNRWWIGLLGLLLVVLLYMLLR